MHYVYVIKSINHQFHYIGETSDLRRRFKEHNAGKNFSTKPYLPFELIYYEAYKSSDDALVRERKLKQFGNSWGHLKRRLKKSF